MLRDITLGQFFPGDSLAHRTDPRLKLTLVFLYITALFMIKSYSGFLLMGAAMLLVVFNSGVAIKTLLRSVRPLVFIISITSVLNLFYTPGDPLFTLGRFVASKQGFQSATFMILRISMLVMGTSMLTYTTSPIMLTDALERVLSPLKKVRVPVGELAMMMTIAMRFIPVLVEEADKIMSAQKARGADFESGNAFQRVKALVPILVPLFVSAFRRADELAIAMECRCYNSSMPRTRLKTMKMQTSDYAVLLISLSLFPAILLGTNKLF